MALKLNERYPGRFNSPSTDYPQGSFKNRTTPVAKDGSYLEKDWANDKEGFFQSLLSAAVIAANGSVDKVGSSQYFDAIKQVIKDTGTSWAKVTGTPSTMVGYGIVLPTKLQAEAGTDNSLPMTPLRVAQYVDTKLGQATETVLGIVRKASSIEALAGTDDTGVLTPSKNKAVLDARGLWATSKVTTDLDAELTTGFYSASGPAIVPGGGLFQVLNTRSGGDSRWQGQLLMGISSSRILYRSKGNYAGAFSPVVEFYSTGNCYLVGASVGFYRETAPPGFLKENGAAVSRTTYAELFALIGTRYGAGDGSTTFNVPDSRALFTRALDDGKNIDTGRVVGSTQAQSIQSHNHVILTKAFNFSFSAPGGGSAPGGSMTGATEATGGTETRPANIAKLYCIKF
ncbi:tail fiber protein [Pseudomonas brenneri]|uniref:phage tail protein n=1 Tax=Pseudomonas brenneri TaxID=129817 RepID=UPI003570F480